MYLVMLINFLKARFAATIGNTVNFIGKCLFSNITKEMSKKPHLHLKLW